MKKVVCFGEVLWDSLPDGKKPGGAPMNVAYHLNRLGLKGEVISRVGTDAAGEELLDLLGEMGLSTAYIQQDKHYPTSAVLANMDSLYEVHYDILAPVAWDFIVADLLAEQLVKQADMLVFGSLAARSETTRQTLYGLIDQAKFRLFDLNFRAPHYTRETVEYLLAHADAVKLNHHELAVITDWLGQPEAEEGRAVARLQEVYGLGEIMLTKGADGASYYTRESRHDYKAYPVVVKDTVGSGDSFLAAFIAQKLLGRSIEDVLDFASALGAYVTAQSGANPVYRMIDLNRFIWGKQLEQGGWK